MSILAASGLEMDIAGESLWRGVSFRLEAGEKAGLAGPNGAGKTTLLKVLLGELTPARGEVFTARKPGYLPQERAAAADGGEASVWEVLLGERRDIIALRAALREAEEKISRATEENSLDLARYGALTESYEAAGGYALEADARRILAGLGLAALGKEKSRALSGGQKTRLALARLLLAAPELLLLDEPTNHLDLEALEWLENFLASYRGAALIVSHDRYFLDRVVQRVFWLEGGELRLYAGNYSAVELLRARELETERRNAEQSARKIAALEEYIRRYSAGVKARQARGRGKQLARLTPAAAPAREKTLRFNLESGGRTGDIVLAVDGLTVAYGSRLILRNISFTLRRGEKTALLGANGIGKTTLLRAVTREIPFGGRIEFGANVRAVYYSQERGDIGAGGTPLEVLRAVSRADDGELRSRLARFGFRGADALKPVQGLSGGEKSRLALCRLFLAKGNLLLLDEPTNHIDAMTREALEEALIAYEGAVLVISHDRYFLDRTVNRVGALTSDSLRLWEGDYSAYRRFRQEEDEAAKAAARRRPDSGREEWERERLLRRQAARAQDQKAELERTVAEREAALAAAEQAALAAGGDYEQAAAWHEKAETLRAELDQLLTRWVGLPDG